MHYSIPFKYFSVLALLLLLLSCNKDDDNDTIDTDLRDIISLEEFRDITNDGVSLMFFHATWCSICNNQRPAVEALMADSDLSDVFFGQVDYERVEEVVAFANVQGFPTMIFYKNGVEVERLNGGGHSSGKIKEVLLGL